MVKRIEIYTEIVWKIGEIEKILEQVERLAEHLLIPEKDVVLGAVKRMWGEAENIKDEVGKGILKYRAFQEEI